MILTLSLFFFVDADKDADKADESKAEEATADQ